MATIPAQRPTRPGPDPIGGRDLAWRSAGVAAALCGPAFAILLAATGAVTPGVATTATLTALPLGAAGAVLVGSPASRVIGRLLVWCAVAYSASLGIEWWGERSGSEVVLWVATWIWPSFVVPLSTLLPLLFPDGHLPSRRWGPIAGLAVAAVPLLMLASAFGPTLAGPPPEEPVPNPWHVPVVADVAGAAGEVAFIVAAVAAVCSLFLRWRRGREERRQLGLVVATAALVLVVQVSLPVLPLLTQTLLTIWPVLFVLAVSIAVWRHGLWDRTPVLRRATLSLVGTTLVVAGYATLVLLLGRVLDDLPSWATAAIAAAVVLLCFEPVRRWERKWLDRRLYGDRLEPLAALTRLRADVERMDRSDTLLDVVAATVAGAVRCPGVQVVRRTPSGPAVEGAHGQVPPDGSLHVRLVHLNEDVGVLVVSPRGPREPWSARDRELLDHLAAEVAVTVSLMNRRDDVAALQAQLDRLAADQRSQLGRDLHDTLGPVLAGTYLSAQSLALRLRGSGEDADRARQVAQSVQRATQEVRRMIEGLGPDVSDGAALVDAVQEHLAGLAYPGAPTFTLSSDVGDLPARTAQTAYLIVLEAVTNVVRHADATSADVSLTSDPDTLRIEVADDGRGLGTFVAGVGMRSIRQRCAVAGGTCSVESPPGGGTRVRAALPIGEVTA